MLTANSTNGIVIYQQSLTLLAERNMGIFSSLFGNPVKKFGFNICQMLLMSLAFLFATSVNAQWYNPFAKKTAEDCVLEKIKDTRGEDAVRALQQSCYSKYDSASSSPADDAAYKAKNKRLEKCGLKQDSYKAHFFFTNFSSYSAQTAPFISNIKRVDYNKTRNTVEFQNNNTIGISGLMMGFTKAKQCTSDKNNYEVITYCQLGNYGTESGVSPSSYGKMTCGSVPADAGSLGSCVVGFSPTYNQFDDSLLEFQERNGFCK